MNEQVDIAREYHEVTKHSPIGLRLSLHRLDWANKPHPFKVYKALPTFQLPKEFPTLATPSLTAITSRANADGEINLKTLSQLLYFSAGLTKKLPLPTGEKLYFRAAACAGALYPVEAYVICGAIQGLPAGVYHFGPKEFQLTKLREGDHRQFLALVTGDQRIASYPATIVLTAIFWRSAWKYQARSYRYCFWDAGTIAANFLAAANSAHLRSKVVTGFLDKQVNLLLGVDGLKEAALCALAVGTESRVRKSNVGKMGALAVKYQALSREEVEYSEILRLHHASNLDNAESIERWKGRLDPMALQPSGKTFRLREKDTGAPLGETILRRGSTRRFRITNIGLDTLGSVLQAGAAKFDSDFLQDDGPSLLDTYLIANAVDGLPDGGYYYHHDRGDLELLKEGAFRRTAGYLCLEQPLAADASAVVFFLSDLKRVLERFGNRGYRAAQLEAGIRGGRMYLAAYSLGLGATGLTFYDDEIVAFFEPHAEGKDAIFVVALGKAGRVRSEVEAVQLGEIATPEG